MDMARQVWDESRHVETYLGLLDHLGGYVGEFPETTLSGGARAPRTQPRVAGVNRGLEGLACDVFNQLIHIARKWPTGPERSVDYVLADEITYVRMGSRWLNELTRATPSGVGGRSSSRTRSTSASIWAAPARRPSPRGSDLDRQDARRLVGSPMRRSSGVKSTQRSQVLAGRPPALRSFLVDVAARRAADRYLEGRMTA